MASENGSETQDDKKALIQESSEEEAQQQGETVLCNKESKLTLYHWTQSFNSQKVSRSVFLAKKALSCLFSSHLMNKMFPRRN
uniref:Uncharacterized protein n=1 Tax=Cyprinodon variegatus TaxID=28743 RepID=A0A3Q2CRK2_CYPVA